VLSCVLRSWEGTMSLPKISLLVLSVIVLGAMAPTGGHAQQTDKPFDFKPLIPPVRRCRRTRR